MGVFKKGRHWYIDYYMKGVRKRKKISPSKQVAELALAQGDQYLFQISLVDAERYKQERLTVVDPSTVNKEVNCLKAMLNKAVAWGYLQTHPLRGMKGLREPPGRLRYRTPEEKARLLDACASPSYLRPIVDLAMHTGMRPRHRFTIPRREWANGHTCLWRACRKAHLPNLRPHDLRHTFASYLAMGGFNLRTIQQLLGHRDLRMTSRYAHLSADHLQQAVKSLDAVLGELSDQEMARPVT